MKKILLIALLFVLSPYTPVHGAGDHDPIAGPAGVALQPTCPVDLGEAVDPSLSVMWEG